MKVNGWLVLRAEYRAGNIAKVSLASVRQNRPSVRGNEVAIRVQMDVDPKLFHPDPLRVDVPADIDPVSIAVGPVEDGGEENSENSRENDDGGHGDQRDNPGGRGRELYPE